MNCGNLVRQFFFALAIVALASTWANALPQEAAGTQIEVIESVENQSPALVSKPPLRFGKTQTTALTIRVDDSVKYQTIEGFGASLTDSSAWLFDKKLTRDQRKAALEMLFEPQKGIGLNVLRQPMGASDFALNDYS